MHSSVNHGASMNRVGLNVMADSCHLLPREEVAAQSQRKPGSHAETVGVLWNQLSKMKA